MGKHVNAAYTGSLRVKALNKAAVSISGVGVVFLWHFKYATRFQQLYVCCVRACASRDAEPEETEDDEEGAADDDDDEPSGARPRRLSELKIPNKVKPIPFSSSLFVFAPTNRYTSFVHMNAAPCRMLERR